MRTLHILFYHRYKLPFGAFLRLSLVSLAQWTFRGGRVPFNILPIGEIPLKLNGQNFKSIYRLFWTP